MPPSEHVLAEEGAHGSFASAVGADDEPDNAEQRVGALLKGKWHLDRVLGVGGTATVYEAHHRNGNRVAVKVMHRQAVRSPGQRARFHAEGMAANRVGHPGVTLVYDDDVDHDGTHFLVMELLHGQTIAERAALRGGTLETTEVLDIAERLLEVLAAAHEKGVVHRDIKPQNLYVTSSGDFKVLDFGIARYAEAANGPATTTEVGAVLGTPAFLPPEQARGRPDEIDARSDVWAVGATLYTLLTGRFVHEAPTRNEQLGLAMMASAPSLSVCAPHLPSALVELIDRALAYSRDERWPNAHSMLAAVRWLREHWDELDRSELHLPEGLRGRTTETDGTFAPTLQSTMSAGDGGKEGSPRWQPPVVGAAITLAAGAVVAVLTAVMSRHHGALPLVAAEHPMIAAPGAPAPPLTEIRPLPTGDSLRPSPPAPVLSISSARALGPRAAKHGAPMAHSVHDRAEIGPSMPPSGSATATPSPLTSTLPTAPEVPSDPMNRRH